MNATDLDKRDEVIFSPLSLWEKRGSKLTLKFNSPSGRKGVINSAQRGTYLIGQQEAHGAQTGTELSKTKIIGGILPWDSMWCTSCCFSNTHSGEHSMYE
jgi:hypothetical protein